MKNNNIERYNQCREEFVNICELIDVKMNNVRYYNFELNRVIKLYNHDEKFKSDLYFYNKRKNNFLKYWKVLIYLVI
jgi:hypothetical protein